MPCYLRGSVTIKNLNLFLDVLKELGLTTKNSGRNIHVYKDGIPVGILGKDSKSFSYTLTQEKAKNGIMQKYAEKELRKVARQKGWKIKSVKEEDGKLKMRVVK